MRTIIKRTCNCSAAASIRLPRCLYIAAGTILAAGFCVGGAAAYINASLTITRWGHWFF